VEPPLARQTGPHVSGTPTRDSEQLTLYARKEQDMARCPTHLWREHESQPSLAWRLAHVALELGGAEWLGVEPPGRPVQRGDADMFEHAY
jgi:hypothetical protein